MCVAVPAKITSIDSGAMPMARVVQGGRELSCCLAYVPEAVVGDHVLVQHGFAVELLDPQAAAESLAAFESLGVLTPIAER